MQHSFNSFNNLSGEFYPLFENDY
uniref:Uncharacterized protein n=1 Tax=Anguilla anguilla TaxID=7936 RepID=A0A0E9SQR6_ANGAN